MVEYYDYSKAAFDRQETYRYITCQYVGHQSTRNRVLLLKHHILIDFVLKVGINVMLQLFSRCLSVPNGMGLDLRVFRRILAGLYSKWLNCYLELQTGNQVSERICRFDSCLRRNGSLDESGKSSACKAEDVRSTRARAFRRGRVAEWLKATGLKQQHVG